MILLIIFYSNFFCNTRVKLSMLIINYSGLVNKPSPDDIFEYLYKPHIVTDLFSTFEYPITQKTYGLNFSYIFLIKPILSFYF